MSDTTFGPSAYASTRTAAPAPRLKRNYAVVRRNAEAESLESAESGEISNRDLKNSQQCAFRLAYRITRAKEDAEDVQQEALLKAYTHVNQFEGRSRITTWISRIAINEALMCLRKRRDALHVPLEDFMNPDDASGVKFNLSSPFESPEAAYARTELRELLKYALCQLRPIYREVFTMRVLENLSTTETAQIGRLSVSTVKTRMRRARMQLRKILRDAQQDHLLEARAT
ncbi:MAG: sigma-70 family RNA polymerase sigma factor [Candidatus Acidiferrales bacterium]